MNNPAFPKPETRRARLISAGLTQPTPTMHRYVETRLCELPGPGGGGAFEFIFECEETSMQRRYGTEYLPEDLDVSTVVDEPKDN